MEDKDLDKIFREAFIEAEETPSNNVWNKIEANLNTKAEIKPIYHITKYWIYAAAILLVSLGGYYSLYIINRNNTNQIIDTTSLVTTENLLNKKDIISDPLSNKVEALNIIAKSDNKTNSKNKARQSNKTIHIVTTNKLIGLDSLYEKEITLTNTQLKSISKETPIIIQVTEIEDIKPLIESDEEEETMLATTNPTIKENKNIITTVLNKISENLDPSKDQTVRFIPDEEGSFAISIINSFAKNRTKKRK